MELILLQKVDNLGDLGDKVKVRAGYGRNFLLPQGMAVPATEENMREFEQRRAELEKAAAEAYSSAQARAEKLQGMSVTLRAKAGEEGKLFGSIGPADIADAVKAAGVDAAKREVRMPEGPIRTTGEYTVGLHLYSDVEAEITVVVEGE